MSDRQPWGRACLTHFLGRFGLLSRSMGLQVRTAVKEQKVCRFFMGDRPPWGRASLIHFSGRFGLLSRIMGFCWFNQRYSTDLLGQGFSHSLLWARFGLLSRSRDFAGSTHSEVTDCAVGPRSFLGPGFGLLSKERGWLVQPLAKSQIVLGQVVSHSSVTLFHLTLGNM